RHRIAPSAVARTSIHPGIAGNRFRRERLSRTERRDRPSYVTCAGGQMTHHRSGPVARRPAAATASPSRRDGSPRRLALLGLAALATLVLVAQFSAGSVGATAQTTSSITVDARDFASQDPLDHFNYIVNVDNTKLPGDPLALDTESYSPL